MSFKKSVMIQLAENSPGIDGSTSRLMAAALAEFLKSPVREPDDYLQFDFSWADKDGNIHKLEPYRINRNSNIQITAPL